MLIFKVAVALGFDAPRAFVLASLRGARDTDFGIQVVGRILRVHRLLQPGTPDRTLPPGLRYGYVFLADADNQGGLVGAGERINAIRDELSKICRATVVYRVGDDMQVQVAVNGQGSLFRSPDATDGARAPGSPGTNAAGAPAALPNSGETASLTYPMPPLLDLLGDPLTGTLLPERSARDLPVTAEQPMPTPATPHHPFRADAERVLQTERLPISTADLPGDDREDHRGTSGLRPGIDAEARRQRALHDGALVREDRPLRGGSGVPGGKSVGVLTMIMGSLSNGQVLLQLVGFDLSPSPPPSGVTSPPPPRPKPSTPVMGAWIAAGRGGRRAARRRPASTRSPATNRSPGSGAALRMSRWLLPKAWLPTQLR
ncbi:hypothetical protein [Candidatus Thiodictyon syntrophicum]|uniref:Uncharacterized protein n=1 Tax=Candidatus Thiodictyon syntrophicum TaxID=1166950 RepID=A0A2K8U5F3_9GAMM|nr:hypothetical protein [Candidatus Thiodictyon syntrophicum]AUB80775.1 hypothetical protein THSYN_07280 [Candidatus Thiodictyon syntrophicum]